MKAASRTGQRKIIFLLIITCLTMLFLASCLGEDTPSEEIISEKLPEEDEKNGEDEKDDGNKGLNDREEPSGDETNGDPLKVPLELKEKEPNELGEIMILMYHDIGHPEGEWRRTPENFRRDLETLYEKGFRVVSLTDAISGNIDIPAGTSPVVLTFDDGHKSHFNYIEDNGDLQKDPECAVYIMEQFYQENPDFGLGGTFYVYYPHPFRESEHIKKKFDYLVEQGFEIGNHTYGHANLSNVSTQEAQRELALHVKETQQFLEGYDVNSLALPYGSYPEDSSIALEGSYNGIDYQHKAVLLVGSNPAPSPFHKGFDASRLPRIRASEMETAGVGMYDWLEYFEENPHKLYISDGNPDYITVPESQAENIDSDAVEDKKVRRYPD